MNKARPTRPAQENIETVARLEQQFLEERSLVERVGDAIGAFAGSMAFVVLHVFVFAIWFVVNTRGIRGIPAFDPYPFILLSMCVSVEAVLLSTFVLMKQNRMAKRADRRNELNLQIDLLAEKEATKTLQLLGRICRHLGVPIPDDQEVEALSKETAVEDLAKELREKIPSQ